jgi:predicted outer membrane protein
MKRSTVFYVLISGFMMFWIACGNPGTTDQQQSELQDQEVSSNPDAQMVSQKISTLSVVELQEFAKEASSAATREHLMAHIATEQARRKDVREFAQTLKDEHFEIERALRNVAADNNWYLPDTLMSHHQLMIDELRLTDSGFDVYYLKTVINSHEKAIGKYGKVAEKGGNNSIATWARNQLPMLRQHLEQGRVLLSTIEGAS